MIHLFKHEKGSLKGKFDFCNIRNGKFIYGSNQGYENKEEIFNTISAELRDDIKGTSVSFLSKKVQDDTLKIPVIIRVLSSGDIEKTKLKAAKKYSPLGKSKQAVNKRIVAVPNKKGKYTIDNGKTKTKVDLKWQK